MDNLTREFARAFMINYTPEKNEDTIKKIAAELEYIYQEYQSGVHKKYIDIVIEARYRNTFNNPDNDPIIYPPYDFDFQYWLLYFFSLLIGKEDEVKNYKEADWFCFREYLVEETCDEYSYPGPYSHLVDEVPYIICGYIYLRNNDITDIFVREDYIIDGNISSIINMGHIKCDNHSIDLGELYDLEENDEVTYSNDYNIAEYWGEAGSYEADCKYSIIKVFKRPRVSFKRGGYPIWVVLEPVSPRILIDYAVNNAKVMEETLYLYTPKVIEWFHMSELVAIKNFVEKKCEKMLEKFKSSVLSKDIITNLIFKYIYTDVTERIKYLEEVLPCKSLLYK